MLFLIGIDDTDNTTSMDTAALAQRLGVEIEEHRAGRLVSVTCHQLLKHPGIPCTTHNQCACLLIDADQQSRRIIELICRNFLLRESAVGSNAGFALSAWNEVSPSVTSWGQRAKIFLLARAEAITLARESGVSIAGFTGSGSGVIGSLAAIGLYYEGNDGRYLWLPGLMDLKGVYTYTKLLDVCAVSRVENARGRKPLPDQKIFVREGSFPILRNGNSLLLVEPAQKDDPFEWVTIDKEKMNRLSM